MANKDVKDRINWNTNQNSRKMLKIWINEKNCGVSVLNRESCASIFNAQAGTNIVGEQVKNHHSDQKSKYICWLDMQKLTGVSFDPKTGRVDVVEKELDRYKKFVKENKHARKVSKGLANLELLEQLFGGSTAQGIGGCFSPAMGKGASYLGNGKKKVVVLEDDPNMQEGSGDSGDANDFDDELANKLDSGDESDSYDKLDDHKVEHESAGKKRRSCDCACSSEWKKRNSSVDTVIQLLSKAPEKTPVVVKPESLPDQCCEELLRMGVEDEEDGDVKMVAAMRLLMDPTSARTFLALRNDNQRRIFLKPALP